MSLIPAFFPGRRDIGPEEPSLGIEDEKAWAEGEAAIAQLDGVKAGWGRESDFFGEEIVFISS